MKNGWMRTAYAILIGVLFFFCKSSFCQSEADDANKSNNPLNLAASFNIQNYFTPSFFGTSARSNDFLRLPP
jgi:hypothetical protein